MKPYYDRDGITIYHGDCREIVPTLTETFDAIVSDPPYGMNANTDSTRFSGGTSGAGRYREQGRDWAKVNGDSEPFDPTPWLNYREVILWGCNHFSRLLPVGSTLIWIKKADHLFGTFLSDAEVAWQKGGHGVYCCRKTFPPPTKLQERNGVAAHPTQKPIALMVWCLERIKGHSILDPYMGSGPTLLAAKRLGRKCVGIEIEESYCEKAARDLDQGVLAFAETPA